MNEPMIFTERVKGVGLIRSSPINYVFLFSYLIDFLIYFSIF